MEEQDVIEGNNTTSSDSASDSSSGNSCVIVETFSPIKASAASSNSILLIPDICDEDYHDPETGKLPILARPSQGLSVTQLFQLMVGTVPEKSICHQKPTGVRYSSVFVVDLSCVSCLDDLRADDNGVWVHGGKPRRNCCVEFDEDTNVVLDAKLVEDKSTDDANVFTLVRLYHRHKSTPEFQRRISYVLDSHGQIVKLVVIQYLFDDGVEVPVILPPHGNAKKQITPYCRTQKTTLDKLKRMVGKPKWVLDTVHNKAGGSFGASSVSELPRDRRQVYNARQHGCSSGLAQASGRPDPFFDLIKTCKEDNLPGGRAFIRSVTVDSSPSCVLALDVQLHDLKRFCTDPSAFCVLGIDPTFNLGKFYVTITTYTYLLVENKTTGISPTFFGPIFIHTEKNYEGYYHFFATLLKLEPKLNAIHAVGTDGETALVNDLVAVFPGGLIHLRCFLHMKENIRRKLTDMGFPESTRNRIIKDIFGMQQGTMYVKGLLDAVDGSEFDYKLSLLEEKWSDIEHSLHPHRDPCFYNWLVKNETAVMKTSMIAGVRQDAGLGCPPVQYMTNRNECMNKVAQEYANYSRSTWVQLSNNMYELIMNQQKEVEKAIYGMGEYKFRPSYRHLEIENSRWFRMTPDQRKKAAAKVFRENSIIYESPIEQPCSSGRLQPTNFHLSVQPDESGITSLPADMIQLLWKKAERLLTIPNGVCNAPGMNNAKCVASESGEKPHIVVQSRHKEGVINCDDACLGWKAQRICAHVLAAAESMGCLNTFLKGYNKGTKVQPNYTAAVTHGLSKAVGNKPSKQKRKGPSTSRKAEIESIVDPLEPVDTTDITCDVTTNDMQEVLPSSSNAVCGMLGTNSAKTNQSATDTQMISSNQILQLNVNPSTALSTVTIKHSEFKSPAEPTRSQSIISSSAGPFQLKFLTALVKICAGCRGPYSRAADGKSPPSPPMDIILVRKEQHLYFNNVTGRQQLSTPSNVHYHANLSCPRQRCPDFDPNKVEVPHDVKKRLQPAHWLFLVQTFGLTLT